ncbi:hypothetical protein CPB86DRAFT_843350 [Serendipita vermifera]|nr:hypothetical protein CPB86DRAFT_843350 [Serendipita vermifera]
MQPRPRTATTSHPLQQNEEVDIVPELSTLKWKDVPEKRTHATSGSAHPPSFAQSEFETIIRRQKTNPHGLKILNIPSRYPTLDNDWEFAGWGSMQYLELSRDDWDEAKKVMSTHPPTLDQFRVSSIAANGVVGSVFYAFPAVVTAAGIFSPISLTVACLLLLFFRPVLLELGSAARSNGANYTYLLQFSSKALALVGAAATLLDAMATSTVSAATATAYLSGEFSNLPIPQAVLAILLLGIITSVSFFSSKDSTTITLSITIIHLSTMLLLMIVSAIAWAHTGSDVLRANWAERPTSLHAILRDIFYGVCIGFLGVSGFETTPSYIELVSLDKYPSVIRNLICAVTLLNGPLILLVYAHIPSLDIRTGTNILSRLADKVAGRWLRTLLVVDAMLVLCGGIVTGLFTACGLLKRLAEDGVLPNFFLRQVPITKQLLLTPIFFLIACIVMYASTGFNLVVLSSIFSVTLLTVLLLYPISNILLKYNRNRLPRRYKASLLVTFLAFAAMVTVLVGNLILSPIALGLFAAYFIFLLAGLFLMKSQAKIARVVIWLYGQTEIFQRFKWTRELDAVFVKIIRQTRRHPICVWIKGDDIYHLVDAILYVKRNEPTGKIIFMHAYQLVDEIPSELAPNVKILDEAFPSITLDLVFVQGRFGPDIVQATSKKLDIPRSHMFMSCFGTGHPYTLADYRGLRLIHH